MATPEQLVDALIDAAYYDCEALAPARAALLAAMGGDDVAWPLGTHVHIDHDGFHGRVIGHYRRDDGYDGVVLQQDGTKVVHVYGLRHLREDGPPSAMRGDAVPVAWKILDGGGHWFTERKDVADAASRENMSVTQLYARPPTPSAIAEGMREACDRIIREEFEIWSHTKGVGANAMLSVILMKIAALPPAPGEGPVPDDGHHFPNL